MEHKHYHISRIAAITGAKLLQRTDEDFLVNDLATDSRKIFFPASSVFFAIRGDYQDGHRYIRQAYDAGVRCFVVSEPLPLFEGLEDFWCLLVEDTLVALQQVAAAHRSRFHVPVIGITGSNGKTIVKDWLYQLIAPYKKTVKSPKSYNSQVGVPLSVWQFSERDALGIFEAGISLPGEMAQLERMIRPDVGIFTNIGAAHSGGFASLQQKAAEKALLFRDAHTIVYCADHPQVKAAIEALPRFSEIRCIGWSKQAGTAFTLTGIRKAAGETHISAAFEGNEHAVTIPFTDDAAIENAVHCWVTMLELGFSDEQIVPGMARLQPVAMRLEIKRGRNGCTVINDSYSADPDSLRIALDTLGQLNQHERKTVILSDILQAGIAPEVLYRKVAELVLEKKVARMIGIGPEISKYPQFFGNAALFFENTAAFIKALPGLHFAHEDILIKGARIFGFETISAILEEKTHHTRMEININAMVHNLNFYRRQLHPGTRLMAMVKAASYGTGGFEIANMLQYYKVDYLAVAYADEGVSLRAAGIQLPVMVMSPESARFDILSEYRLEPEIYSFSMLERYIDFAATSGELPGIHIKLDTGMHRLGFDPGSAAMLAERLAQNPRIKVLSVFSHLAAADDAAHDEFTRKQLESYHDAYAMIAGRIGYRPLRHILNSGGISRFGDAQMDMVRLGVGMYGVGIDVQEQQQLQEVVRLRTVISQIRTVPAGESIGYSRSSVAGHDRLIATVPVGYADGLRRSLSNGRGKMIVNGKPAPVAGRICMDMAMIDITGIDAAEGDEVTVIGDGYGVKEIAADAGTIAYEILTGISERVKRVYIQE